MIVLQGQGVSKGIAKGPIYFYQKQISIIEGTKHHNVEKERERLQEALNKAKEELNLLAEQVTKEAGEDAGILFETHALFLEDDDFIDLIEQYIQDGYLAEYAVQEAGKEFSQVFAQMDDNYLRTRAADVLDVSQRVIGLLVGTVGGSIDSDVPVILVSDDLAPSETVQLDKSKILAIATCGGSGNSHTAILARTMGIPAVCGLGNQLSGQKNGQWCYILGETGQLIFEPDEETLEILVTKQAQQAQQRELLEVMIGQDDVTLDGKHIKLYCNIGSPEDVDAVLEQDGQGIGLFRSEFLYLAAQNYPTEEEQFQAYKEVVSAMKGKRVIIRTLDIGADKQVDYFQLSKEENPAMGLRAIRICLNKPEVFRTQLRALYRASAFGKVAIMFPMITSVWEVKECLRACQKIQDELRGEGIPFDENVELGIMIETPAAVMMASELAKLVHFFSVGTNDLTQYMLACDRQCSDLGKFFDPHHPAVLRALKMVADAAHEAGIWIGICGELAADRSLIPTFMAMGIDELSVSPSAVLPLRAVIRSIDTRDCNLTYLEG